MDLVQENLGFRGEEGEEVGFGNTDLGFLEAEEDSGCLQEGWELEETKGGIRREDKGFEMVGLGKKDLGFRKRAIGRN